MTRSLLVQRLSVSMALLSILCWFSECTLASATSVSKRSIISIQKLTRPECLAEPLIIRQSSIHDYHLGPLQELRGGSSDVEEISMDPSSHTTMGKIRNMIRSILQIGERKAPALTGILKSFLKGVESMLGVELLPPMKKTQKKKSSSKKKVGKKKAKASEKESSTEETKTPKKAAVSATTTKHLSQKMNTSNKNYRIQKELKEFIKDPPPNLSVKVGKNIRVWIITMVGAENTIYEGEVYKLRVSFPPQYPTVPPSVYFLPPNIPKHEHVYTNGDICLSLLGKDWRPTMTAQSIANSILSILSSAQSKSIPMDNAKHAQNKPGQYQQDWVYHDDNC